MLDKLNKLYKLLSKIGVNISLDSNKTLLLIHPDAYVEKIINGGSWSDMIDYFDTVDAKVESGEYSQIICELFYSDEFDFFGFEHQNKQEIIEDYQAFRHFLKKNTICFYRWESKLTSVGKNKLFELLGKNPGTVCISGGYEEFCVKDVNKVFEILYGEKANFDSELLFKRDDKLLKNASIYDFKEGNKVKIFSGKYSGMNGVIKKINFENETIDIDLVLFGRVIRITEHVSLLEDPNVKNIIYPSSPEEFRNFGQRGIKLLSDPHYIDFLYSINNEDLLYHIIYNVIYNEPELFFKLGFDNLKFLDYEIILDFILRLITISPDSQYLEKYLEHNYNGKKIRDIICQHLLDIKPDRWIICFKKYNKNDLLFNKFKQIILSNPSFYFVKMENLRFIYDVDDNFVKFYFEEFLNKLTESGFGHLVFSTEFSPIELEKYFKKIKDIADYIKIYDYDNYKKFEIENSIIFLEKELQNFRSREDDFDIENEIEKILESKISITDKIFLLEIAKSRCEYLYPGLIHLFDEAIQKIK